LKRLRPKVSSENLTARYSNSGLYRQLVFMTPSSQSLDSPKIPERFIRKSWRACQTETGKEKRGDHRSSPLFHVSCRERQAYTACSNATATATLAPTIGLLPMPIKPIISTWAGTEEEPANWASECILPMVSVMP